MSPSLPPLPAKGYRRFYRLPLVSRMSPSSKSYLCRVTKSFYGTEEVIRTVIGTIVFG